jgi:hypothetical protein
MKISIILILFTLALAKKRVETKKYHGGDEKIKIIERVMEPIIGIDQGIYDSSYFRATLDSNSLNDELNVKCYLSYKYNYIVRNHINTMKEPNKIDKTKQIEKTKKKLNKVLEDTDWDNIKNIRDQKIYESKIKEIKQKFESCFSENSREVVQHLKEGCPMYDF